MTDIATINTHAPLEVSSTPRSKAVANGPACSRAEHDVIIEPGEGVRPIVQSVCEEFHLPPQRSVDATKLSPAWQMFCALQGRQARRNVRLSWKIRRAP